ncbi:MAG: CZB domain-containing protein [Leptospiraceae bacterium]|nr:CZB domain-containing protein [Leptospiraceae bacterium]
MTTDENNTLHPRGWTARSQDQWLRKNKETVLTETLRGRRALEGELGSLIELLSWMRAEVANSGDDLAVRLLHFPAILEKIEREQGELRSAASEQMESTKDLATVSEGLDAVAHEISRALERGRGSARKAKDGGGEIKESILNLHEISRGIAQESEQIRSMNDTLGQEMGALSEVLAEVEKRITHVKGLSEQTNMLALNASIEAARAGEYGHGFAVVADGVSDLAAKSSDAVKSIERALESMNKKFASWVERASGQIEQTNKINQSVQDLEHIIESNSSFVKTVQTEIDATTDSYLELEQQIQEIKKTTSVISDSAGQISGKAEYIHETADKIREDIGVLDKQVSHSVEMITNQNPEWLLEFLKRRRRDHLKWMTEVDQAIQAGEAARLPQLDHRKCNMGLWIYKSIVRSEEQKLVHGAIEEPHQRLHATARSIAEALRDGRKQEVGELREKLQEVFEEIARRFNDYEFYLEKLVIGDAMKKGQEN